MEVEARLTGAADAAAAGLAQATAIGVNVDEVVTDEDDDELPPDLAPMEEKVHESSENSESGTNGKGKRSPVPVTIITGFLGAGKTTLLNYILTAKHGQRIAVIENEFGDEIGVESLIAKNGADGKWFDEFFELGNGCICCSVKDDLVNTLERLLERRDRFDYILVETTGMANPGPLAATFWVDDELECQLRLDGIVTLVDCKNVMAQLGRLASGAGNVETLQQIAYADRILLNKTDLVDGAQLESVKTHIASINPVATCSCTVRSRVDLPSILHIQAFDAGRLDQVTATLSQVDSHGHESGHGHEHEHAHGHQESSDAGLVHEHPSQASAPTHTHTSHVSTLVVSHDAPVPLEKFERWVSDIIWDEDSPMEIFRMKGIVNVDGSSRKHLLQVVHDLFELVELETRDAEWADGEERSTRVVVIGRYLDGAVLRQKLLHWVA